MDLNRVFIGGYQRSAPITSNYEDDFTSFKQGDRVELTQTHEEPNGGSYGRIIEGEKGTVCRVASTGSIGVSFDDFNVGHDCNRTCKDGTGLYIKAQYLKLIPKSENDEFKELMEML